MGGAEAGDPPTRTNAVHTANHPAAFSGPALPPHNPPPLQLPSTPQHQAIQSVEDQDPILSVNSTTDPSGPTAAGTVRNSLSNGVRSLQERARELWEERARVERIQAGTRKRHRRAGARPAAGAGTRDNAEEHDARGRDAVIVAMNRPAEKSKRPRAAQDASLHTTGTGFLLSRWMPNSSTRLPPPRVSLVSASSSLRYPLHSRRFIS